MITDQYRLQRFIGKILPDGNRTSFCCTRAGFGASTVRVCTKCVDDGGVSVSIHGVAYCSSVWVCPVCSRVIRNKRAKRTTDVFRRTMAAGYNLLFVTYTLAHDLTMPLGELLQRQRRAWRIFTNSYAYREAVKSFGTGWHMRALEVTHSPTAGWHPHYHAVYAMRSAVSDAIVESLYYAWAAACSEVGAVTNRKAWHYELVQDPTTAASYLASWGGGDFKLGYEVAADKKGRRSSRSPFQLAADAMDGDESAERWFVEYAAAIRGSRAQTWSRAWRDTFALEDTEDETITDGDLVENGADVAVVLHTYEYEKLGSCRDEFILAVAGRDLSGLYDILDRRSMTCILVNLPLFYGGRGSVKDTLHYGGAWARADHLEYIAR